MTEEERLLQQGKMVQGLRDAKRDLGCIDNRLDSIKASLSTGVVAIDNRSSWKDHDARTRGSASFPSGSEVLDLLDEREGLADKIEQTTEQLGI